MINRADQPATSGLRRAVRLLVAPIRWIRESESDLDGTYPDRRRPTGEEAARQGSVITSLTGLGNG